jgi:hypothetical protein
MNLILTLLGLVTYALLVRYSCDTRERGDWHDAPSPFVEFISSERKNSDASFTD